MRLHNCLLAAASVLIGFYLAGAEVTGAALAAAAMALSVCAGGYALNDIYDVETDRLNKPWRPLPSRRISRREAVLAVACCWGLGLACSVRAGRPAPAFALSYMGLIWLYCYRLKSGGVAGHMLISAVSSSGFILGGVLGGRALAGAVPFFLACMLHFARELVKGVVDLGGDRRTGVSTLPVRLGERGRVLVCTASIVALMALCIVPYAAGVYGLLYMLPVLAVEPMLGLCIYLIVSSRRKGIPASRSYGQAACILKAVMPVGLLAFLLGGV